MYNETIKDAFIIGYSRSIKTQKLVRQIFESFEEYEKSYGCDLCMFSAQQLQPIIDKGFGVRQSSTDLILNILKKYVKWCASSGYEVSNGVFSIRTETASMMQEQMVSSPLDLKTRLDSILDPPEQLSIDSIYRTFLWMAFSGISDEEAVRVTSDEVNLQYLYIDHGGVKYEIYKESIRDFQNVCNLNEFWFTHPNYSSLRKRAEGNLILRGFLSPDVKVLAIRPALTKKLKGCRLSYHRVQLSGVFYRARERERIGIPVDFSQVVEFEIQKTQKERGYTLGKNRTLQKIMTTKIRNLKIDYERWKNAFDV